ncbi:hypothetical protein Sste5346_000173 [Sporothrix stenoceras]|uniref:Mitochondrial ribosomal protein n=1 Tax=Sporothrix stenoceras TaxID=5173 RepID=A0ABR3ZSZ5_9PEZI
MSVAAPLARRPLRCCVQATTTTRQALRQFATSTTTTNPSPASTAAAILPSRFQAITDKTNRVRTAFAVYSPPPPTKKTENLLLQRPPEVVTTTISSKSSSSKKAKRTTWTLAARTHKLDVRRAYDQQQIARMDPTGARTQLFSRKNPDRAKPGDVLIVTPSKAGGEAFGGVLLAVRHSGIETAILLRGQLAKTSVEMWYKIYSRSVAAIDIIQRSKRRTRRAKLTYMRQPKHDRGSVDDLIKAWRRTRVSSRARSTGKAGDAKGRR